MRALHTAATGMLAQELNVQVISNNIANMRTTGYKEHRRLRRRWAGIRDVLLVAHEKEEVGAAATGSDQQHSDDDRDQLEPAFRCRRALAVGLVFCLLVVVSHRRRAPRRCLMLTLGSQWLTVP